MLKTLPNQLELYCKTRLSNGKKKRSKSTAIPQVPAACQVPNLPTTVPATIGNIDMSAPQEKQKNMEPYQQASSVQKIGVSVASCSFMF